jgi:hypothetical protein
MHNIDCSKTPDKAICKARKRWRCWWNPSNNFYKKVLPLMVISMEPSM